MTRRHSELYSDKNKPLLLSLLICYPIINFLIINTYKIKFVSEIFYLFFLVIFLYF